MKLEDSHGGYHGKSLQEKIRDDLDEAYALFKEDPGDHYRESFAEGIAHALGVLRSTSADTEWEAAQERFANPVPAEPESDDSGDSGDSVQVCCPDHKRPIRALVVNETPDVDVYDPNDDFADNEFDEEFL